MKNSCIEKATNQASLSLNIETFPITHQKRQKNYTQNVNHIPQQHILKKTANYKQPKTINRHTNIKFSHYRNEKLKNPHTIPISHNIKSGSVAQSG